MADVSLPVTGDPAFLTALLEASPGATFLLDAVGTIRFATTSAAQLVDRTPEELVGESVLSYVDEDTAWTYAAAVALAADYPDQVAGPLRITVVTSSGEHRTADLWAENRLDDPHLCGIVCLLTPASAAMGMGEALQALAGGADLPALAAKVARALRGMPVGAEAAVVAVGPSGTRRLDAGDGWLPEGLGDGPWTAVAASGIRSMVDSLDEVPEALAAAARQQGFATVWVEPIVAEGLPARGALVVWRRHAGRPSPNELNVVHQAAAILALAWDRHERLA